MALIDQYTGENTPQDDVVFGNNWQGQILTTTKHYTITSVDLKLWKEGSPGTLTIEIRTISGGLPTSTIVASGTFNANTLGDGMPGAYVNISLGAGAVLSNGVQYAIIAYCGGDGSNRVRWRTDAAGTYGGGSQVYSENGGVSFTTSGVTLVDNTFKTYGDEITTIDYTMPVTVGAFTLTGVAVGLLRPIINMVVTVGNFALTGVNVTLSRLRTMAVSVGNFILTGIDIVFRGTGSLKMHNQPKSTPISPTNQDKNDSTFKNQEKS